MDRCRYAAQHVDQQLAVPEIGPPRRPEDNLRELCRFNRGGLDWDGLAFGVGFVEAEVGA